MILLPHTAFVPWGPEYQILILLIYSHMASSLFMLTNFTVQCPTNTGFFRAIWQVRLFFLGRAEVVYYLA